MANEFKGARVFADSGAYSAMTQGAAISCNEYIEWCHKWRKYFVAIANLDVIGNAEATLVNQQEMEAAGIPAIPVYHAGEPWHFFESYCRDYPYVALGGTAGMTTSKLFPWHIKCFKHVRDAGLDTKFHAFGMTSLKIMLGLPWYSVDSSSWGSGYRFGTLRLFDPRINKMCAVLLWDRASVMRHAGLIQRYGCDPLALLDKEEYHWTTAARLSAASWREVEAYCRRVWGPIPLKAALFSNGDQQDGMNIYLAGTATPVLEQTMPHGMLLYLADGSQNALMVAMEGGDHGG